VVLAALVARRWRLRDMAVAASRRFLARLIGVVVVGLEHHEGERLPSRFDEAPSFPVVRLAVIVAVIAVASPYPPARPAGSGSGVAARWRRYLGTGLPDAAFATIVLGWGLPRSFISSSVRRVDARPAQVAALNELTGFDGSVTSPANKRHGTIMHSRSRATDGVGPGARVTGTPVPLQDGAIGALQGRRPEDAPHPVERGRARAYVTLSRSGPKSTVPPVVVAGSRGRTPLLARRSTGRRCLKPIRPRSAVLLDDLWRSAVSTARRVSAERARVVIGTDGAAIVGFEQASFGDRVSAPPTSPAARQHRGRGNDRAIGALRGPASQPWSGLPLLRHPQLSTTCTGAAGAQGAQQADPALRFRLDRRRHRGAAAAAMYRVSGTNR
jgi:hypothetical protein